MKKWLLLLFIVSSVQLSAQRLDHIEIDPLNIPEFKPSGPPSAVIDDLKLWYCGDFYVDIPVLVRSNKDLTLFVLRSTGGEILNFGRHNEFLIKPDTSGGVYDVNLYYQGKSVKQPIHYIHEPELSVTIAGQSLDQGMLSISAAKTNPVIKFEGEYDFKDMSCYPISPEVMVEGQVELIIRGAVKHRFDFPPSKEVDIKELLEMATPGSQLRITQKTCLVEGNFVNHKFHATYTVALFIN